MKKATHKHKHVHSVNIESFINDSTLNVRAIEVNKSGTIGFAASDGRVGEITNVLDSEAFSVRTIEQVTYNEKPVNFRSMAIIDSTFFVLGIASPALLYKLNVNGKKTLAYKEEHEKAFYDAMAFWNTKEGIAIGDATDECISIIVTRDSGNTWTKLPCEVLPKFIEGEAAYAASDTNIAIVGDSTWVATGGKASRILFSPDKGITWTAFDTPIIQGLETTGMYSLDFYDELNGFAIGGDYTKAEDNSANKIRTKDGGKTWHLVAENQNPGYRSCVQYIPGSNAKSLVAVGFKGIDYSNDSGDSWQHLSDEGFYTLRFLNDSTAVAAGKGRLSKLTFSH